MFCLGQTLCFENACFGTRVFDLKTHVFADLSFGACFWWTLKTVFGTEITTVSVILTIAVQKWIQVFLWIFARLEGRKEREEPQEQRQRHRKGTGLILIVVMKNNATLRNKNKQQGNVVVVCCCYVLLSCCCCRRLSSSSSSSSSLLSLLVTTIETKIENSYY